VPGGFATAQAQAASVGFLPPSAAKHPASECWTVTAADVDAWVASARPNETFIYAHGPQLVQGGAAARVSALHRSGDVTPHQRRAGDGGFDFIVRRCQPRRAVSEPVCTAMMMRVLVAIQEDAQAKRRCRSDSEIGAAADLSPAQVKWQLNKLEDARFITRRIVPARADPKFRVITVTATGQSTAMPEGMAE
jgi:hypothetical protein